MVFTRDLRTCDNPALSAAWAAGRPLRTLFVLDGRLLQFQRRSVNRIRFLADSLVDLAGSLTDLGVRLNLRSGDWVSEVLEEALAIGACELHLADDYSAFANRRLGQLESKARELGVKVCRHPGVSVVPPGDLQPSGGGGYKVFTPYFRRWSSAERRPIEPALQPLVDSNELSKVPSFAASPGILEELLAKPAIAKLPGGEKAGRERMSTWLAEGLSDYSELRDLPARDSTSRLSPYLHFGCLSPLEVATSASMRATGQEFVRQIAWRDFYLQILAHRPDASVRDFRERGDSWSLDPEAFDAWTEGRTGFPLVDAAMRQLACEGFMHNRCRMVTASFLVKDLYIDWRIGARHFMDHLIDGDVASNQLGWQWVAGTGQDSNPHRILNPTRQSERFDPNGDYIRRWVPELAEVLAPEIHCPADGTRLSCGYPDQIVDHAEAVARFRMLRK